MQPQSRVFLYLLQTTREGNERSQHAGETNSAMVVRAANSKHARTLATEKVIDEPKDTWENGRYSSCRRLGEVTDGAKRTPEVIVTENNAS